MTTINYKMAFHPWSVWGREVPAPRGVEYICQQSGLWQHRRPVRYRYPGLPESVPEEYRLLSPKEYAEKRMEEIRQESYPWDQPKTPAEEAELRRKVTPKAAPPKPPGKAKGYVKSTFVKHGEFVLELRQNKANWSVYLYLDQESEEEKGVTDRVLWAKATGMKAQEAATLFKKANLATSTIPAQRADLPDTSLYMGEKGKVRRYKRCIIEEVPVSKRKSEFKVYLNEQDAKTGKVYKYAPDMDTAMSIVNDYAKSTSAGQMVEQTRLRLQASPNFAPEEFVEEYEGCIITRKTLYMMDKKTGLAKNVFMFPVYADKYMYEAGDSKWLEASLESARKKAREGTR